MILMHTNTEESPDMNSGIHSLGQGSKYGPVSISHSTNVLRVKLSSATPDILNLKLRVSHPATCGLTTAPHCPTWIFWCEIKFEKHFSGQESFREGLRCSDLITGWSSSPTVSSFLICSQKSLLKPEFPEKMNSYFFLSWCLAAFFCLQSCSSEKLLLVCWM